MPTNRFFCTTCGTALHGITGPPTGALQCPACVRALPLPRPGGTAALPPEVLALEVKFLCTVCRSTLRADARWEGRTVICLSCGDRTIVPQWSGILQWPRASGATDDENATASPDAFLTSEEIAFLSETAAPTSAARN